MGVKEWRREGRGDAKLNVPNPDDVSGIYRGDKDWGARAREQMIFRIRPPVIAGAFVAVDPATAEIPEEDRLRLVRELSRLFGVSVSDGRLREYV